ncbi:MAG: hypothetical protein Q4Q06_02485 [Bacteroidota bacterium]|nr:hypothetical protein [Bacteroidota bacterium]
MKKYKFLSLLTCVVLVNALMLSCIKEEEYTTSSSVTLKFSQDTITFDTIFTTIGSITKKVVVYNKENDAVKINTITLAGGQNSYYRMNVDGNPNILVKNIDIGAKDSIMIFVRVELDRNNQNIPLLIQDSIILSFNGKQQSIQLLAYGQDAYYHKPTEHTFFNQTTGEYQTINCSLANENSEGVDSGIETNGQTIMWKTDKPHVIVGTCVVNGGFTLKLQEGNKIYMANNASILVMNQSSLNAEGSVNNPILFTSLRQGERYSNIAGQWSGIQLSAGSKNNVINHAKINNATVGLTVDTCITQQIEDNTFSAPTLKISNTQIENCSFFGLYARGSVIDATNLIIQNTGSYTLALSMGGNYRFIYSTFANYWASNPNRNASVLVLNDWYTAVGGSKIIRELYNAEFYNCVIYGNLMKDEVEFDLQGSATSNYKFDHCLIKTSAFNNSSNFATNCLFNIDPLFKDAYNNDVSPMENSPLIGNANGMWNYSVPTDIYNNYRSTTHPTIGAIEYVQ